MSKLLDCTNSLTCDIVNSKHIHTAQKLADIQYCCNVATMLLPDLCCMGNKHLLEVQYMSTYAVPYTH